MRFLIYLFLVYIAYRIIRSLLRPKREISPGDVIDEMVKCSFCETYVPRREAIKRIVGREPRNFCSEACADKYARLRSGSETDQNE
ncbi:MAG: hypothetical protein JW836_00310 [Deltaproteobacteria bacterium]|nr:hypothetical protein [Deltaproteobacteria bacterium]